MSATAEYIRKTWTSYSKFLLTVILPVFIGISGFLFAVYQYYESKADLRIEIESIVLKEGGVNIGDRQVDVKGLPNFLELALSDDNVKRNKRRNILSYFIAITRCRCKTSALISCPGRFLQL